MSQAEQVMPAVLKNFIPWSSTTPAARVSILSRTRSFSRRSKQDPGSAHGRVTRSSLELSIESLGKTVRVATLRFGLSALVCGFLPAVSGLTRRYSFPVSIDARIPYSPLLPSDSRAPLVESDRAQEPSRRAFHSARSDRQVQVSVSCERRLWKSAAKGWQ